MKSILVASARKNGVFFSDGSKNTNFNIVKIVKTKNKLPIQNIENLYLHNGKYKACKSEIRRSQLKLSQKNTLQTSFLYKRVEIELDNNTKIFLDGAKAVTYEHVSKCLDRIFSSPLNGDAFRVLKIRR